MRIAIVVYDHADDKTICLAKNFISAGYCVKFVYFKHNNTDMLPKDAILTVLDCTPTILSALNPAAGLRKWTWAMYRWGDTDLVICGNCKLKSVVSLALGFDSANVPVTLLDETDIQQYIDFARDNFDKTHTVPKYNLPAEAKVLVVELGSVGDINERSADIKLLKEANPELKFWLFVKPPFGKYALNQPFVDGVIEGNKKPFNVLLDTARKIRTEKFAAMTDIAFGGGHSKILQALCFVPNKYPRMAYNRFRDRVLLEVPDTASTATKQKLSALGDKKVFVCVGAGGSRLKQWPNDYWVQFLNMIITDGWQPVFCGNGENEKNAVAEITDQLPDKSCLDLVNETSLTELNWIATQCQACVGNDTGLLHIAALAGVPSIGLFSQPTAWRVGLRMPWFTEIHATNEIKKFRWENKDTEYVLDRIKPEEVYAKFREICLENKI